MSVKDRDNECCEIASTAKEMYRVEAIVSIDDRGQMVLPKDVRQKFDLQSGDKLAIVLLERQGKICCIQLLKAQDFSDKVKGMVGSPILPEGSG